MIRKLKSKRCTKNMNFNERFKVKWNNEFLKRIGYFEPIISLNKLFN